MSLYEFRTLYQKMHSLLTWINYKEHYNPDLYNALNGDMQSAWAKFPTQATSTKSGDHVQNVYNDIIKKAIEVANTPNATSRIENHLEYLLSFDIENYLQKMKRICEDSFPTETRIISSVDEISTKLKVFRKDLQDFIASRNQYFVDRNLSKRKP